MAEGAAAAEDSAVEADSVEVEDSAVEDPGRAGRLQWAVRVGAGHPWVPVEQADRAPARAAQNDLELARAE